MHPLNELTTTERNVAILVYKGLTNADIAKDLGANTQVVKNHLRRIFDKCGVWSRLELAL